MCVGQFMNLILNKQEMLELARFLKDIEMVDSTNEGIRMIKQNAVSVFVGKDKQEVKFKYKESGPVGGVLGQ